MRDACGAELSDGRASRSALAFCIMYMVETDVKVTSIFEKVAPLLGLHTAFHSWRRQFDYFLLAPIQSPHTGNKRGGKKQLRRKLPREHVHYAATATCYHWRGCKRPASPPGWLDQPGAGGGTLTHRLCLSLATVPRLSFIVWGSFKTCWNRLTLVSQIKSQTGTVVTQNNIYRISSERSTCKAVAY